MNPTQVIHARDLARYPDAIYIGREHAGRGRGPSFKRSRWANPWSVTDYGRFKAVALYARWINGDPEAAAMLPPGNWHRPTAAEIRDELRGARARGHRGRIEHRRHGAGGNPVMKGRLTMTTLFGPHAIWTDGEVMEAMHAIRNAINEWERVGAAEEVDLDDMAEVESKFVQAMSEFQLAMKVFHERRRKTR